MKLAFVVHRYGKEIFGGAETYFLNLAKLLSKFYEIEIITTCALDYVTWKNYYDEGICEIDGIKVRRFKVDFERNNDEFNQLSNHVLVNSHSLSDEIDWMKKQGPYSSDLFNYIEKNNDNYDLFLFGPYLYATTYFGIQNVLSKSILIPMAHDELPLKLSLFDKIFQECRAIIFQTKEEKDLTEQRFVLSNPEKKLIGQGVVDLSAIPKNFKPKLHIPNPYVFYLGRIDKSKGCDDLINYFEKYIHTQNTKLSLVMAGPKIFDIKKNEHIIYLGIIDDIEKSYFLKNADLFIMPSKYESFSIVTMESWLAKTPVLVNGDSEVLKSHCEKSNGGLYYQNFDEFLKCMDMILKDPNLRKKMGNNGYDYVHKNYLWNKIIDNYKIFLDGMILNKKTKHNFISSNNSEQIITFVIPWYGQDLVGGAETLCRKTVERLSKHGVNVEVFTTCSKEFLSDWSNFYDEGIYKINEISVRRFSVDSRDVKLFDSINYKLIHGLPITEDEEILFFKNNINSSNMMKSIDNEKDHRIYIFLPYLYGTTFFGSQICPKKSIMIPCLHDESYAYMKIIKNTLKNVKGLLFNSNPEKNIAERIYDKLPTNKVVGTGVSNISKNDSERFKKKFQVDDFILYTGRKDPAKNLPLLLDYYEKYIEKNGSKLDLIITGPGKIIIPEKLEKHVRSLFLSKNDLYDAYSAALVTCQPSLNESFSFTIMESWLCSTPVLVHENCDVTKDHCIQSNGGLYFSNYEEFEGCINYLLEHEEERKLMAFNGKNYVIENYDWEKIVKKYSNFINNLFM